jgi:hypothetical protein
MIIASRSTVPVPTLRTKREDFCLGYHNAGYDSESGRWEEHEIAK